MTAIRDHIQFLLNDKVITVDNIPAALTLLDYLRLEKRLRGTKEGCAEGDCGACTVLVGRVVEGELIYETVNSCIRFVGTLDGCHVVTVEHLRAKNGQLHPVQQAMVDHHGSQCGFCTPGFIMSLYGLWMTNPRPSETEIETALQGNLCRCTGYAPIIRAAQAISANGHPVDDPLVKERRVVMDKLQAMDDGATVEISCGDELLIVPATVDALAQARKKHPKSTIVAGSTDVGLWVTKHMKQISPVIGISHLEELQEIETTESGLSIGAGVTYTQLAPHISRHFPQLEAFWHRIGGEQVRNMGTIGGNVANGSPIGDTPPVLIALGATLTLRRGDERRTLPLEEFFIEYGKQNREPGDFVEQIFLPFAGAKDLFATYKISKRRDEDISAVCGAFRVRLEDGLVQDAAIAFGGMAGVPKRAGTVEHALIGNPWTEEVVTGAMAGFDADFAPLSDWRASAGYRMQVSKNLLRRFFLETSGNSEHTRLVRVAAE